MSSADRVKYSWVNEVTPGTTPSSAAMKLLRITGESLKIGYDTDTSKELSDDRVEREMIVIGQTQAGDVNHEMLWDAHNMFQAAVLGKASWTVDGVNTKKYTVDNGTTVQTFTVLKQFTDLTNINHAFKGMRVNTWNLTFPKKGIITGTFGLLGSGFANGAIATVLPGSPTFAPSSGSDPMNSSSHITSILLDDVPFTSCIDTMGLQFTNNYRPQDCLGAITPADFTMGRLQATMTADIYFKDETLFNKYKAGTAFSLNINLTDNDGNQFQFDYSRGKFEDMEIVASGTNQDVIARCRARFLYDTTDARLVRLTYIGV